MNTYTIILLDYKGIVVEASSFEEAITEAAYKGFQQSDIFSISINDIN